MEILLWLVPAAAVTTVAMLWAGWAGRPRREQAARSEAAYERFARAVAKPHPAPRSRATLPRERDRSTGIAVRPSRRPPAGGGVDRRPA